jgi:hypothetical protein
LQSTCGYAELTALGDDSALLVYSHFKWFNTEGVPAKTLLAAKVRTVKNS